MDYMSLGGDTRCVPVDAFGQDREVHRLSGSEYCLRSQQPRYLANCKISGSHGCDYEECRLLGYKNPVRTSQETHYVSTTESSQIMLYKI
jgi:hypothetical protein